MVTKSIKYSQPRRILWIGCLMGLILLLFCPSRTDAQTSNSSQLERNEIRAAYLNISIGLNTSSFRDYATSPLIYSGRPIYTSFAYSEIAEKRESYSTMAYSFGNYSTAVNDHTAESQVNTVSLVFQELFRVAPLSNSKVNFKVGGQFITTVNLRRNEDLFNNRQGVDLISNLCGSMKITLDLSRNEPKTQRILFLKYKVKERVKNLSYTMNIGVVNSSYRNGFAYTNSSALINEDEFFKDYEFQVFRGFRVNSTLAYTFFLTNSNAIQLSYRWDAFRTGGHHDNFEMATHTLQCSLLFSLK